MGNRKNIWTEVGSILVFALGLFTLAALFSYRMSDDAFFAAVSGLPHNACGRVGAYLSSVLLNCFGLGAFLFPVAFFLVASNIHKRDGTALVAMTLGGMSVAVATLTIFLALHWRVWSYGGTQLLTGGAFGAWFSDRLIHQFNPLGASIVTLVIFSISVAVSTPIQVAQGGAQILRASYLIIARLIKLSLSYTLYAISLGVAAGVRNIRKTFSKMILPKVSSRSSSRDLVPSTIPATVPAAVRPADRSIRNFQELIVSGATVEAVESLEPLVESPVESMQSGEPAQSDESRRSTLAPLPALSVAFTSESGESNQSPATRIRILPREDESVGQLARQKIKGTIPAKPKRGHWQLPTIEFLRKPPYVESSVDREKLIANSQILTQKFADFGIDGEVTAVRPGPVITLYEFKPGPGVKVSRIAALADDLSMALSAQSVRILAPLPGKSVVGIEIPSENREIVYLREFLQDPDFYGPKHSIPVVMGKDIGGQTYLSDLARMPHLLCAGQTGSGKSVFMNGLICSLFYRFTPDELRMILVDPKFIEFRAYQDMPHLLLPVVDDPKQAATALKWAVREMERRYRILAKVGARNLASFNQKVDEMGHEVVHDLLFAEDNQTEVSSPAASGADWIEAFEPDPSGAPRVGKLPYIVVIIDELADLMMIAKKEVEISIARIAQKARAAGIHLIIATQRPSTDVVTGLIKANLPSRVSFQLASYVDSKTILDRAGAERLLGQGDMLFIPPGVSQNLRLHGAFLDDDEIGKITSFLKAQGKPVYRDEILLMSDETDEDEDVNPEDGDELFVEAVELVKHSGHASASFLQRHLKIGYNRAARMIETMESRGIVGPQDGARPREVLMR
jgi:S-DNA-T family DNA segregation ATPase FtsK/SpoIIIE